LPMTGGGGLQPEAEESILELIQDYLESISA
jgi:hypothetical protein